MHWWILFYSCIREEYAICSNTYPKDMPNTLNNIILLLSQQACEDWSWVSYRWIKATSQSPKFSRKSNHPNAVENASLNVGESNTCIQAPTGKEPPAGHEQAKRSDAINFILDKASEKATAPCSGISTIKVGQGWTCSWGYQQAYENNE